MLSIWQARQHPRSDEFPSWFSRQQGESANWAVHLWKDISIHFKYFGIFWYILRSFEILRDPPKTTISSSFGENPLWNYSMGGMLLSVKTINTLLKKTINSVLPAYIRQVLLAVTGILPCTKVPGTYQYVNVSRPPPLGAWPERSFGRAHARALQFLALRIILGCIVPSAPCSDEVVWHNVWAAALM